MDLDELFGDGAELGQDVIVKAQLRFRIHPPKHPVAQDIVDRLIMAYDERVAMICDEVDDVLQHADVRRSHDTPLVLTLAVAGARSRDVVKAAQQPYAPGTKGGKWYRDGQGHVRYGEQPQGKFKQRAKQEHTQPHVGHYRPKPFMGIHGSDRDVTGFLLDHVDPHGFSAGELRFLGSWYGTDTKSGALFDAFLDCTGLTREDLKAGTIHLQFGSQHLTYEEAVFEFFAAQESLFMGEGSSSGDETKDWNTILNDEIKPILDSVFSKYEALKDDEDFQKHFAEEPERQRRRFFENARRHDKDTRDLANRVIGEWDPERQVADVIAGMKALGLFAKQSRVDHHAHVNDHPHLRGAVAMDGRLLTDGPRSPLIGDEDKLSTLSASQLMLLYAAAELHRRWDPDTRSYSPEKQSDIGAGVIGEKVLVALENKSSRWAEALGLVRGHLDEMVDRLVTTLNDVNAGEGTNPGKQKKSKPKRSKK